MNTTRERAARMHSARLSVVRRSSSMMPILTVLLGSPSSCSTASNRLLVRATSSGPCIFGLTTYTEPAGELRCSAGRARSCLAISVDTTASRMPSGTSLPVDVEHGGRRHQMTDVANQQQRPAALANARRPSTRAYVRSGSSRRMNCEPALSTGVSRSPRINPSQLRYAATLSVTVDGCDRVLEVDDRRDRRLDHDVGDPRRDRRHRSGGRGRSRARCRARGVPGARPTAASAAPR